jgi:DUF177 domain-containing protein
VSVALDVRDLIGHPGSSRAVRVAEQVPGLETAMARVPEERSIAAALLLESVVEGILASGPLESVIALVCSRCLTTFEQSLRVEVSELFVWGAGPEDDEYPLLEGEIDIEPMIRDAVLTEMPFAPLCRPDCLGLCPRCGGDRNLRECDHGDYTQSQSDNKRVWKES